ncbi:MAG: hypothetical protein WC389_05450 [Lutibacter sp.]|jgi:hypothetical protein
MAKNSKKTTGNGGKIETSVKVSRPEGELLVSGASQWDFEQEPEFFGTPLGSEVVSSKDGKTIGYDFVDDTGQPWVIGASHGITKALEKEIDVDGAKIPVLHAGRRLYIKWIEKVQLKGSDHSLNKYEVILLKQD